MNNGHTPRNDWYKCQGPEADLLLPSRVYVPRRSGHELPAYLGPFEEEQAAGTLQFLFEDRDL